MREIKYRAWDNVADRMYYTGEEEDVLFIFNSNGIAAERIYGEEIAASTAELSYDLKTEKLEHLIYMECTGLKDVNGDYIFEGDIVKYISREQIGTKGNYKNSYAVYGDVEVIGEVKFGNIERDIKFRSVNTFIVESSNSVSYDSYFFSDSKNRGAKTVTSNLTKPLFIDKEYEIIGNVYESPDCKGVN